MELYEKIVYLRRKKGLSQQELANKLDISRQSVYKWEQGISSPDLNKLLELAHIFDVTVDQLIDDNIDVTKIDNTGNTNVVVEEIKKEDNNYQRRSMLDYLLMIPFGLGIGIVIFMFYCFGVMAIGMLYVLFGIACLSPIYGIIMIGLNISNGVGAIFISIAIIIAGLGSIYPFFVAANSWKNKYLSLSKVFWNKIKSINWRKML